MYPICNLIFPFVCSFFLPHSTPTFSVVGITYPNPVSSETDDGFVALGFNVSPNEGLLNQAFGSMYVGFESHYVPDVNTSITEFRVGSRAVGGGGLLRQMMAQRNSRTDYAEVDFWNDTFRVSSKGGMPLLTVTANVINVASSVVVDSGVVALSQQDPDGNNVEMVSLGLDGNIDLGRAGNHDVVVGGKLAVGKAGGGSDGRLVVRSPDGDTLPVVVLTQYAAHAGSVSEYVGDRSPAWILRAPSGSIYHRVDGARSNEYINRSPEGIGTTWLPLYPE